jgi:alpha-glutamyl/putrescinyl thymine pyrophosphorylase-like protein
MDQKGKHTVTRSLRPGDRARGAELYEGLAEFEKGHGLLRGIKADRRRASFVAQLVESERRVRYVAEIRAKTLSPACALPGSVAFNPVKAAVLCTRSGDVEEASWLVFLLTHFGRHRSAGWAYVRDVYGALGERQRWSWNAVRASVGQFREWLNDHQAALRPPGQPRGFGNHRKYESLNALSTSGTGAVVASYVRWIDDAGDHRTLFERALRDSSFDPEIAFDLLYRSMNVVARFGRMARFDYLTMIAKVGVAAVTPGSAYLRASTGPLAGARLLVTGRSKSSVNTAALESRLSGLAEALGLGWQEIEDALCNWQKSPAVFTAFRG